MINTNDKNLEVEIKNFYILENERDDQAENVKGNLHVTIKLADILLSVKGVLVSKQKGKWFFRMPFKYGIDKTGISTMYPILSFDDDVLNKSVISEIFEKGPAFIDAFLKANPQEKQVEDSKPGQGVPKSKLALAVPVKSARSFSSRPIPTNANWITPPPPKKTQASEGKKWRK